MAHLIERKKGFGIRFYAEVEGEKKQIYLCEDGWTKEDAKNAMNDYLYKLRNKKLGTIGKETTLTAYLEKWFEDVVVNSVSSRTARSYAECLRLHIIPDIGYIKLVNLSPQHIQSYYTKKLKTGMPNRSKNKVQIERGLSPTTVLYHHKVLKMALKHAVELNYIHKNPCDIVKPPRKNQANIKILTDNQVEDLLKAAIGKPLFIFLYIALTTGMRRGEICGLQLEDVDTQKERFTVVNNYQFYGGELKLGALKTKSSKRIITMLPGTCDVIKKYIEQRTYYKNNIPEFKESNFFCVWPDGKPFNPDYIYKAFVRLCKTINIEGIRVHDLRHTHATMLLKLGIHPKVVSERLGHTRVNITLDTYSHVLPELQKDALSKIDLLPFKTTHYINLT